MDDRGEEQQSSYQQMRWLPVAENLLHRRQSLVDVASEDSAGGRSDEQPRG